MEENYKAKGSTITKDIPYDKQANIISEAKNEAIEKWNMRVE